MFYVMNVCLQHVWNTTLVSVILKDISVPLLATLLCGVCNWSTMFCVYGNPNNCRLQRERTYRAPTLIKLQIMCCEMSNFIAQHTAIYCCIVVLITFVLCTVLFIFLCSTGKSVLLHVMFLLLPKHLVLDIAIHLIQDVAVI